MTTSLFLSVSLLIMGCEPGTVQIGGLTYDHHCLTAAQGEVAIAIADFDEDGHEDLAVGSQEEHTVMFFRGDGKGGFSFIEEWEAGEHPTSVHAADINGDNHLDLVIANHETSYLTLLHGNGHGDFQPAPNSPLTIPVDPHPHEVRVTDMDVDGWPDLIVDHRNREGLLIFRGMGKGRFDPDGVLVDVGGDPYRGFVVADLNGDLRPDLITPNTHDAGITLSAQPSGLAFHTPSFLPVQSLFAVGLSDFNGDGLPDIVAASNDGSTAIQLFYGIDGGFNDKSLRHYSMVAGAKGVITGNLNGDAYGDAVVSSWSGEVLFLLGHELEPLPFTIDITENPWGLAMGDLNGDGLDDVVIGEGRHDRVHVLISRIP